MESQEISLGWALSCRAGRLPLWKRLLDFTIILMLSPALLLFGLAISLLVKRSSPGPVLFRQRRIGYQGREFTFFKFRTMKVNADAGCHQNHTRDLFQTEASM